jgi:fumarate reductase flavoprotein subunit/urocanate reductase
MWMVIGESLGTQTADTVSVGIWSYRWDDPYYDVNSNGERFMDEGIYYEHAAKEIARQDGGFCWTIWDQRTVDNNRENISAPPPSPGCEREIEDGYWKRADTIEELAELIDVPVENLVKTHERYNTMMQEDGEDKDFGRHIGLYDMPEGPYYAAKTVSTSPDTAGGLKINKQAQVQDVWGESLPNLYAAGATTAGWRGQIYPGCGHAITNAVVFGRIAGQEIAEEERDNR